MYLQTALTAGELQSYDSSVREVLGAIEIFQRDPDADRTQLVRLIAGFMERSPHDFEVALRLAERRTLQFAGPSLFAPSDVVAEQLRAILQEGHEGESVGHITEPVAVFASAKTGAVGEIMVSKNDLRSLLSITTTPKGELALLDEAIRGTSRGVAWIEAVQKGLQGDAEFKELVERPLVRSLRTLAARPLAPEQNPVERPWGVRAENGKTIGEWYFVSDEPYAPNVFAMEYAGLRIGVPITILSQLAAGKLFGQEHIEVYGPKLDLLVKRLTSGRWDEIRRDLAELLSEMDSKLGPSLVFTDENFISSNNFSSLLTEGLTNHDLIQAVKTIVDKLPAEHHDLSLRLQEIYQRMLETNLSVQLHPVSVGQKTEAWHITYAGLGAGIYYGLKNGVTKKEFEEAARAGKDTTVYMQFFPVHPGQTILIKAGMLHAMGGDIELIEPQQPGGRTLRIYDYGRKPQRELHIDEALTILDFSQTGQDPFVSPRRLYDPTSKAPAYDELVGTDKFRFHRISFKMGDTFVRELQETFFGYHVNSGSVSILDAKGNKIRTFKAGDSFIVPAAMNGYKLVAETEDAEVFEFIR